MAYLTDEVLQRCLLADRPGISGIELSLGSLSGEMVFSKSDWVSAWEDTLHVVWSDDRKLSATRAITRQGRLIWLVRAEGFRRAYHARALNAESAFREARSAWRRREEFRARKAEIRRIVREMRFLKVRHEVTVEDAYASPLCEEGVDGFLRSLRLDQYHRFPGWLIAWLHAVDRQIGFVLYEARKRHEANTCHHV